MRMETDMKSGIPATLLFVLMTTILQADEVRPINPQADHVERWNWFVDAVYALHKKQVKGRTVKTEERTGGYYREPEFFREQKFTDAKSGQHISTIQWERAHPDRIHAIEVYVRDGQGRVVRDYSALFLTHSRNAPQQTLINLYAYNDGLQAFRQFDATDNRTYERCRGTYQGRKVSLEYDEMQLLEYEDQPQGPLSAPLYKACFRGLPAKSAGKYLTPQ